MTVEAMRETELLDAVVHPWRQTPPGPQARTAARWAIGDAVGLGFGTYDHPALAPGLRMLGEEAPSTAATVWCTGATASVELAILLNGTSVRCYDYNDVMRAPNGQGGHPGDIVPGLVAVAEERGSTGRELVDGVIAAFDAAWVLFGCADLTAAGWDYTNYTGLAAIVGFGRLLAMSDGEMEMALGIYAASRLGTNQYESGMLDSEGNFPSWKRINGAEATLAGYRACRLAKAGYCGPFDALTGRQGFFAQQGLDPVPADRLGADEGPRGVELTEYKLWPVGTMAHAPILAALAARESIRGRAIGSVEIAVDHSVVEHLVRDQAWSVHSRETSDHSLPYIVAAALVEGEVAIDQFNGVRSFSRPEVLEVLRGVTVTGRTPTKANGRSRLVTDLRVRLDDGEVIEQRAEFDPETLRVPAVVPGLEDKFRTMVGRRYARECADELLEALRGLDDDRPVRAFTEMIGTARQERP